MTINELTRAKKRESAPLTVSLDDRCKLDGLLQEYKSKERPTGVAGDYRAKIDQCVKDFVEKCAHPSADIFKAFSGLRGALVPLSVKSGGLLSEAQRAERDANAEYRKQALNLAETGMSLFSPPTEAPRTPSNDALNKRLVNAARDAAHSGTDPVLPYAQNLFKELEDKSLEWNSVNIVTAIKKLHDLDTKWYNRAFGRQLCEGLIDKLSPIALKQKFDAYSVSNLAEAAPSLITALSRANPKDPIREKRLFGALSRTIEFLDETPDERFAGKSFLVPLREVSTRGLTAEGAAALCGYVARVNTLFSEVSYSRNMGTIASTFHSLGGITTWHQSRETDAKLVMLLSNLNDRLQNAPDPISSSTAGCIVYGLKGLDVRELSPEAVTQVTRTLRAVTRKLNDLSPQYNLDYTAFSSIVHGLTLALEVKTGPLAVATQELLSAVTDRIPPQPKRFDELGALCGALVTLRPHAEDQTRVVDKLWLMTSIGANQQLPLNHDKQSNYVSWQTIQQAFALYGEPIPRPLARALEFMSRLAYGSNTPTASELRLESWARQLPGATVDPTRYIDGFELDLLIHPNINIEIDGAHHAQQSQRLIDKQRDDYLSKKPYPGLRVIRVPNTITWHEFNEVVSRALEEEGVTR